MFLSFWTDFTFWSLAAPVNFPVSTPTPPRPPKCTLVLNNVSSHWIPFYLLFCLAALYHMIWVQINHNEISNWTLRVFTSYTWQLRIVCCFKSHECFRPPWLVTFRQKNQQSRMWTNWMQKKKKNQYGFVQQYLLCSPFLLTHLISQLRFVLWLWRGATSYLPGFWFPLRVIIPLYFFWFMTYLHTFFPF